MSNIFIRRISIAVLISFFVTTGVATAETVNCTVISSLPYTISTQGIYCLHSKLATNMASGSAITITTNNVTLDLNGYAIGDLAAGAGTNAVGILAAGRNNVTIKDGVVRGFSMGVDVTGSGDVIDGILADSNTVTGLYNLSYGGVIRNSQAVNTGGSTNVNYAYGIWAYSSHADAVVENNLVSGVNGSATSYGIYINGVARNNTVALGASSSTTTYGIAAACVPLVIGTPPIIRSGIDGNIIMGAWSDGVDFLTSGGVIITCTIAPGYFKNNAVSGSTTGFSPALASAYDLGGNSSN